MWSIVNEDIRMLWTPTGPAIIMAFAAGVCSLWRHAHVRRHDRAELHTSDASIQSVALPLDTLATAPGIDLSLFVHGSFTAVRLESQERAGGSQHQDRSDRARARSRRRGGGCRRVADTVVRDGPEVIARHAVGTDARGAIRRTRLAGVNRVVRRGAPAGGAGARRRRVAGRHQVVGVDACGGYAAPASCGETGMISGIHDLRNGASAVGGGSRAAVASGALGSAGFAGPRRGAVSGGHEAALAAGGGVHRTQRGNQRPVSVVAARGCCSGGEQTVRQSGSLTMSLTKTQGVSVPRGRSRVRARRTVDGGQAACDREDRRGKLVHHDGLEPNRSAVAVGQTQAVWPLLPERAPNGMTCMCAWHRIKLLYQPGTRT